MKIEMAESLFYSWLRHVKECQIVQTNWKVSGKWELLHEQEILKLISNLDEYFSSNYNYNIFKKNASVFQIIQQAECDVLGVAFNGNEKQFYAIDVAFHEGGLNYGLRDETVMKVLAKIIRTAICLYGYVDSKDAEIIFASPKINPAILDDLVPCINDLNNLFRIYGYEFAVRIIANEQFDELVLQPILLASGGIADTSELFIRAYQMYGMFENNTVSREAKSKSVQAKRCKKVECSAQIRSEFKIGKLAKVILPPLLQSDKVSEEEILLLQEKDYCKKHFDIQYPLLLKTKSEEKEAHYYKERFYISGESYRLCCEWFENEQNNDRPYLEKWIFEHEKINE